LKIRLIQGKYIFLDEAIYENEEFSQSDMEIDANDYWSGMECKKNNKIVVLFEGKF